MRLFCALLSFLVLVFVSCRQSDQEALGVQQYYNLDSLFDAQIETILQSEMQLTKRVVLDGESEEITIVPTKDQLEDEFRVLREFDLNKPSYIGSYNVIQSDTLISYELKPDQKSAIKYLRIVKIDSEIYKIKGQFIEEKDIYNHRRLIQVNFQEGKIISYSVSGYQDMIMGDSVHFKIEVLSR